MEGGDEASSDLGLVSPIRASYMPAAPGEDMKDNRAVAGLQVAHDFKHRMTECQYFVCCRISVRAIKRGENGEGGGIHQVSRSGDRIAIKESFLG